MSDQPDQVAEHDEVQEQIPSNWEFIDKIPTVAEVVALLGSLPPVHGVDFVEIAEYVQGLPSKKKYKIKETSPTSGREVEVEKYREVVTLYVSVAGRLKQANLACETNGWRMDFVPEPVTPTGVPGFLQMDERLVYREYVDIYERDDTDGWRLIGRRPGQAWVPKTGGTQAAGSNPYEKVETSARGRALAAWGFGVLPGSGIASLEEMVGAKQNERAVASGGVADQVAGGRRERGPRPTREQFVEQILTLIEEVRQARGKAQIQMFTEVNGFAINTFGKPIAGEVDDTGAVLSLTFDQIKDGQLQLLVNALQESLQKIRSEEGAL